jgi:hypothetical protein
MSELPLTLAALQAGTISWAHARILVQETAGLDRAGTAGLEAHFLDPDAPNPARGCPAGELVASRFRVKARIWRERHHPAGIEERHATSAADRRIEYTPDRDGMAWLSAYFPADTAAGIWERATAAARALQGPDEPRTLTQLRADLTATWLLTTGNQSTESTGTGGGTADGGTGTGAGAGAAGGGPGTGAGTGADVAGGGVPVPRAQVLVTVPVLALLGATEEPAVLDGYGPIPPSMARRLLADGAGSFHRVLPDPRDGAPLEIGRASYRLTTAQRHWLRLRDGRCPFPGCGNHSLDNEADHLLAWADGGTTGLSNLGQPCPKHHRLKHASAWTPAGASKDHPPGWTSPAGRHYPSEHQDWEPPHWPEHWDTPRWPEDREPPRWPEDREPPRWPEDWLPHIPATDEPGPEPGTDTGPDQGLPADPGHRLLAEPLPDYGTDTGPDQGHPGDPDPGLPPDPFPDWHQFTAGHPLPDTDTDDPGWAAPADSLSADGRLFHCV